METPPQPIRSTITAPGAPARRARYRPQPEDISETAMALFDPNTRSFGVHRVVAHPTLDVNDEELREATAVPVATSTSHAH